MWLFTIYGFYSIACARNSSGQIDPDTVMVRARKRKHLKNLKDKFPQIRAEISTTTDTDYRYRMVMPKPEWLIILGEVGIEQNWSNFKSKVDQSKAMCGHDYSNSLHEVWEVMYRLQQKEEKS